MASVLVLASQSPRRKEILERAGFSVTVRVSGVPEQRLQDEEPEAYVRRLAAMKADAVALHAGEVVLGADTVVVIDGCILEKPQDEADAHRMLRLLSGRNHAVITGVCLRHGAGAMSDSATTLVHFNHLSDEEIRGYVASGEPRDKAGAYAIQGLASKFIDRIEGDYFNVMGLPVSLVYRHLRRLQNEPGLYSFAPG
jgi:septum formation protein